MTSRHFTITINGIGETEEAAMAYHLTVGLIVEEKKEEDIIHYAVYGVERGDTGNYHIQMYVQTKEKIRPSAVKRWFAPKQPHIECSNGSSESNIAYVKKEGEHADKAHTKVGDTIVEVGHPRTLGKGKGKRSDIDQLDKALKAGKTELEICDELFPVWLRFHKVIPRYHLLHVKPRTEPPKVEVHVGAPGAGKTRSVFDRWEENEIFNVPRAQGTVWFDMYEPRHHKVILFDDFYGWCPWDFVLRVTDRYKVAAQTKGGMIPVVAPVVVFTSNKGPREWYKKLLEEGAIDFQAFVRRVTRWVCYRPGGVTYDGASYERFSESLAFIDLAPTQIVTDDDMF